MNYDKPFKTFDEQIDYLKNEHGLIIKDRENALFLLSSLSYYDLINGYKECFMINDKYINDMSINDLYYFLVLDRNIQSILFKYSVYVENRFKNLLAYVLSEKFGVDMPDYLNINNFKQTERANIKFQSIMKSINQNLNSDYLDNPTKHYKETKNHIPAWILVKNMTFNDCIDLFFILNNNTSKTVCSYLLDNKIDIKDSHKKHMVLNALIIVRKFRNKIAHNLKFITYRTPNSIFLKNLSKVYGGTLIERKDFKDNRGMNDVYSMFLSITTLLREPKLINAFLIDFNNQLCLTPTEVDNFNIWQMYCDKTGLPINIKQRIERHTNKLNQNNKDFKNLC